MTLPQKNLPRTVTSTTKTRVNKLVQEIAPYCYERERNRQF